MRRRAALCSLMLSAIFSLPLISLRGEGETAWSLDATSVTGVMRRGDDVRVALFEARCRQTRWIALGDSVSGIRVADFCPIEGAIELVAGPSRRTVYLAGGGSILSLHDPEVISRNEALMETMGFDLMVANETQRQRSRERAREQRQQARRQLADSP